MARHTRNAKMPKPWPSRKYKPDICLDISRPSTSGHIAFIGGDLGFHGYVGHIRSAVGAADFDDARGRTVHTALSDVYREATKSQPSISSDIRVLAGKPCLRGTRIPIALVLRYLATGDDPVEDLEITQKDVADCLEFAAVVCDYSVRVDD